MWCSLAFLILTSLDIRNWSRATITQQRLAVKEVGTISDNGVGVGNVRTREILNRRLQSREVGDNLRDIGQRFWHSIRCGLHSVD